MKLTEQEYIIIKKYQSLQELEKEESPLKFLSLVKKYLGTLTRERPQEDAEMHRTILIKIFKDKIETAMNGNLLVRSVTKMRVENILNTGEGRRKALYDEVKGFLD